MHDPKPAPILVSACLCGRACRYNGRDAAAKEQLAARLAELGGFAVPFCPEEEGGLSTPRPAAWIEADSSAAVLDGVDRVVTEGGEDVTSAFQTGAKAALAVCQAQGIRHAILKERSPSCGVATTHVNGQLTSGRGITAELLAQNGMETEGM